MDTNRLQCNLQIRQESPSAPIASKNPRSILRGIGGSACRTTAAVVGACVILGCGDSGGQTGSVGNGGSAVSSAAARGGTNQSTSGGSSNQSTSSGSSNQSTSSGSSGVGGDSSNLTSSGGAIHSGGAALLGGSGGASSGNSSVATSTSAKATGGNASQSGGATQVGGSGGGTSGKSGGVSGATVKASGGAAASTLGGGGRNTAGRSGETGVSGTAAGGASGSNTSPVDYGAPGPYAITVEENVGENFRNDVEDDTEKCKTIMAQLMGGTQVPDSLIYYPKGMDWQLYTLFRPTKLEEGKKYPVITWGDGTCSNPQTFSKILEHLASHGFLVIASNYRQTGDGKVMLHAVDFMLSENENAQSALYGKVDTQMIGACGHSQGSMATVTVGADRRIVATVPIQGANATAAAALKGPTFLIAGEKDTTVAPSGIESAFNAVTVPAVYGLALGADHTMPPVNPAPILGPVTAWFKIHLANDTYARDMFYGTACKLCSDPGWTIKRKNL